MTDIHSCSYYCDRPECIKAQRDELRDKLAQLEPPPECKTEAEQIAFAFGWFKALEQQAKLKEKNSAT